MLHVYEFEVFEDEGWLLAFPYDMEGGTQGADFKEVCEMAADWLQGEMERRAMHDVPFPEATFDNEPRHGGRNVVVAVSAGLETIDVVTASEAADMLASRARACRRCSRRGSSRDMRADVQRSSPAQASRRASPSVRRREGRARR